MWSLLIVGFLTLVYRTYYYQGHKKEIKSEVDYIMFSIIFVVSWPVITPIWSIMAATKYTYLKLNKKAP